MIKKILSFFGILFVLISFQACKDKEDMQISNVNNKYFTTTNDINILKEDAIKYIQDDIQNDSLVVFNGNTPDDALPKIGSKIFIPISPKSPSGFLGKVKSVEKGNPIKVFTESLPLEEAFDNLSIDTVMNVTDKVEGIFDSEGNAIEYEVLDSTLTESTSQAKQMTRAGGYWQGGLIKFPFTFLGEKDANTSHKLVGTIYVELKNFSFNVDIANNEIKYIDVKADPAFRVTLSDESKIRTPKEWEKRKLIGSINLAPITIPTPVFGLPIILRPKIYLYLVYGAKGEITASTYLQYQCSYKTEMHYRNGKWDKILLSNGLKNERPWNVTKFDVDGNLYIGSKMGILVGLYSATTGIGINVTPKFSLGAKASLNTENLLDLNPQVELAAKWSGDLYFTASLFKRPIAHYSFSSPEYVVWSEKMYLLPQFKNFTATGGSSSGDISYQIDNHYFLSMLGVKTGTKVYKSDKKTEFNTYYPSPTNTDNKGNKYYNVNVKGLTAGNTYYAAPVCSWLGFTWPSSTKHEFATEASYQLGFRCSNHSYDVISFNFSLNNTSGNTIDYTTEAQDYNGEPMRVHITAQYNSSSKTLNGIFDFYFYNDPSQQRKDGFSVSLATDDSGYVDCDKVIDNGGCYAALRIYKAANSKAARKKYNRALVNDDCNVGIFNKNYSR